MDDNFFADLAREVGDPDTMLMDSGLASAEFAGYIDTGCYALNAALSGSIFGGMPDNKVLGLAGESSVGKTYFALSIMASFQERDRTAGINFHDTESAVTKKMALNRGIDPRRVLVSEPTTIQSFRHKVITLVDKYMEKPKKTRPPLMVVLDSLGNLSSTKELEDTAKGEETKDMTKAQLIRATFRVLRLRLARANIPMIVTNHVYAAIGAQSKYPVKEIAGGGGFKYCSDMIAMITKSKDKDDDEVVGNFITVKMVKSRLSRENCEVTLRLSYTTGLDKYYGLLEFAEKGGVFKKISGGRYEFPDGSKPYGKHILEDPTRYFTQEVLEKIDVWVRANYQYGDDRPEDDEADLDGILSGETEDGTRYDPQTGEVLE